MTAQVVQAEAEVFTSPMRAPYPIPLHFKPTEETEEIKSFLLEPLPHPLPWRRMDPVAAAAADIFPFQAAHHLSK